MKKVFFNDQGDYDCLGEPEIDDTVLGCPNCDMPNQFGELCWECQRESDQASILEFPIY